MQNLATKKIETDAHNLAAGVALQRTFAKYGISHALSFHSSIKRAEVFAKQQEAFSDRLDSSKEIVNTTISSKLTAGQRSQVLQDFTDDDHALITNARCLTEGIDIPSIDCVTFVDPKQSRVDIVQAAGRAMRQSKKTGKKYGYILLPVIVPVDVDLKSHLETTDFKAISRVITTLSTHDKRISDELKRKAGGAKSRSGDILKEDTDIFEFLDLEYGDFEKSLSLTLWKSVGPANWVSYQETETTARSLKFKSATEWRAWASGSARPADIPSSPEVSYKNDGWINWGHFLGTGTIATKDIVFLPFEEARSVVQSKKFSGEQEYRSWHSKNKPKGIPYRPDRTYSDEWRGMGISWYWNNCPQEITFLPFKEARAFVQSKKLSGEKGFRSWHSKK